MSTSKEIPSITAEQAEAALAENRRRQAQTVAAGTSPWPARVVVPVALALPALGYLLDLDMVWLFAMLVAVMAIFTVRRPVQLRPEQRSRRWDLAVVAAFAVALGADVAVQFAVSATGSQIPNTWGLAGTAVVVLVLVWPLQQRAAARMQP